jgi:hypothetical protein
MFNSELDFSISAEEKIRKMNTHVNAITKQTSSCFSAHLHSLSSSSRMSEKSSNGLSSNGSIGVCENGMSVSSFSEYDVILFYHLEKVHLPVRPT